MARTDPQVNFRMPQELRDMLDEAAKESKRTLTAEIVARLEQSFRLPDQISSLKKSYDAIDAAHDESDSLAQRVIELYEAQKALSDLQQGIIDQLLSDGAHIVISTKQDMAHPEQVFEDAVQSGASDDPVVAEERERRISARTAMLEPLAATEPKLDKPTSSTPTIPGVNAPKRGLGSKPKTKK